LKQLKLKTDNSIIVRCRKMPRPILIVEDDQDIAEGLRYNLEREGLTTCIALTGE